MGKELRHTIFAVALAVGVLAIAGEALAAGTMLAYAPKKGDTGKYTYSMATEAFGKDPKTGKVSKMEMLSASAQAVFRSKVIAVTDKGATSSYTFQSANVQMMGQKTDVTAALNKAALKTTFSRNGKLLSIEGLDKLDMSAKVLANAAATAPRLPAKPVSVGATWKAQESAGMGEGGSSDQPNVDMALRLAALTTRGGRRVAKITIALDSVIDLAKIKANPQPGQPPPKATGKIIIKGTGTAYVDVASGMTIEMSLSITSKLPAEVTGAGALDQKNTMSLKRIGD
jgi:hypothetical protein